MKNNQNESGSVNAFAQEMNKLLCRDKRSPEEIIKERDELRFAEKKHRILAKERWFANQKESVKRKLRGDISDE
jgi:hypothetical protein